MNLWEEFQARLLVENVTNCLDWCNLFDLNSVQRHRYCVYMHNAFQFMYSLFHGYSKTIILGGHFPLPNKILGGGGGAAAPLPPLFLLWINTFVTG